MSGQYIKQPDFINNHAWWRNKAFAIWFDGETGKKLRKQRVKEVFLQLR